MNHSIATYFNMVKAGIIDPAKVVRAALQNPASVGSIVDHYAGDALPKL